MGLFYPFGSTWLKDIYIGGMFNNYSMTPEYKMNYNVQKAFMKKTILVRIYKLQIHHSRWEEWSTMKMQSTETFIKLKMSTLH
jgi:hypothetical protein